MSKDRLPPGPRGHFLVGSLPEYRRDPLDFYTRCAREYGDIVYFRLGPRRVYQLNHPDLIEHVLVTANRNFQKNFAQRMLRPLLGNGLLTSEGDFWRRQRRLAQPAFLRERVTAYADLMVAYAERMADEWRAGEARDLHADMMRLTLEIAARTLFGADVGGAARDVGEAFALFQEAFSKRLMSWPAPPRWLPTPNNLRLWWAARRLDAIVYGVIKQRRASGEERDDLLSRLLHAQDEDDGGRMTDQQLRAEVMTLLLAGHETTALALSWTWYLLAGHPEADARLAAELAEVLGGRPPTAADLPRLRFAEAVVLESMRLYPPAYGFGREAVEDCELGGYRIPAGANVFLLQWVVHRDPRWFADPEKFRPERWLDGLASRLPKYAYFPFGGGPRLCIGNAFAMTEAILVVAALAQRFRFALAPGQVVTPWPSITLRPRGGMRMTLAER